MISYQIIHFPGATALVVLRAVAVPPPHTHTHIKHPQQLFPDVFSNFSEPALYVHIDQSGTQFNSSPEKRNNRLVKC